MPSFTDVNPGDPATALSVQEVKDALKGTAGKGIPISVTAVNDPLNFALAVKNTDSGASKAFIVYKADATVLFQIDKNGVAASPDGVLGASQLATLAGAQTFTNKTFVNPIITGLTVSGATADGSTSALIVRDSAAKLLLSLRDDGLVLPGTPTSTWDFTTSGAVFKLADFSQAQHAHTSAATGGALPPGVPTGTIADFAGSAAPTGWLLCDGSAVSRTVYAALFAVIGTTYGVGDGSTTFNVPDLRGRVAMGVGTGSGLTARALAAVGGEETHILTTAELAAHPHTITDPTHNHTQNSHPHSTTDPTHNHTFGNGPLLNTTTTAGGTSDTVLTQSGGGQTGSAVATGVAVVAATATNVAAATGITTTANAGSGTGHNNVQPFIALTKIVKV